MKTIIPERGVSYTLTEIQALGANGRIQKDLKMEENEKPRFAVGRVEKTVRINTVNEEWGYPEELKFTGCVVWAYRLHNNSDMSPLYLPALGFNFRYYLLVDGEWKTFGNLSELTSPQMRQAFAKLRAEADRQVGVSQEKRNHQNAIGRSGPPTHGFFTSPLD